MRKLTETEKQQIEYLLKDPKWQALVNVANEMIRDIQDESSIGRNQFETLKLVFLREGKIRGIRDFFQKLNNIIS